MTCKQHTGILLIVNARGAGFLTVLAVALLLNAPASVAQRSLGISDVQLASDFRQSAGGRPTFVCPASDGVVAKKTLRSNCSGACDEEVSVFTLKQVKPAEQQRVTAK